MERIDMREEKLKVACLQYCATDNLQRNLSVADQLIEKAVAHDADLLCLPEACDFLCKGGMEAYACRQEGHRALGYFREKAEHRRIWLFVGSLTVRKENGRLANRSFVIDPEGVIRAKYDKIHMFDAAVPGHEVSRESDLYEPGTSAVVLDSPWGGIGLSICYDVRFPHLYRRLSQSGAGILAVPAAFTFNSGKAHWRTLLRSRAIENGCFVLAAGQCGNPYEGRASYGHSMIIDPWGGVLAEAGEQQDVITAELDLSAISNARHAIASLKHDREFGVFRAG